MSDRYEEEAKCYETIGKERYKIISRKVDTSESFPFYAKEVAETFSLNQDELIDKWRNVRNSFERFSGKFSVIGRESKLFPPLFGEEFLFIYAMGNSELLRLSRVTVAGALRPSYQGKSDTISFVRELVKNEVAVISPIEAGIATYALTAAIKAGGKAIGVSSSPAGKLPRENLIPLYEELVEKGLVITPFSPHEKSEPWLVMIRNIFLSSLSTALFIPEERDGGPSWAIVDPALNNGARLILSQAALDNRTFSWMTRHKKDGAVVFSSEKDVRKFIGRKKETDTSTDLFT